MTREPAPATPGLPPFAPLREVSRRLAAAGLVHALGASGLLYALGLLERVADWDLTTDGDESAVRAAIDGLDASYHGSSGVHADRKFVLHDGAVELIVGFAVRAPGGVCRLPTVPSGTWRGVPLGAPEVWAAAYALIGRPAKAALLFTHLRARGARKTVLERLLAEPLPGDLADALAALPRIATP